MFNLFKIFIVIAIYYITSNLFSHGGGLNSEGCHNNKKNSDYHCHRKKKILMKNITENHLNINLIPLIRI